ncbi:hypothetical protein H6504_04165 [Candidatus Woesearchaeota archaeon]|nr:hypothetical protein [Candidatus Woesearchaeota archaeon]
MKPHTAILGSAALAGIISLGLDKNVQRYELRHISTEPTKEITEFSVPILVNLAENACASYHSSSKYAATAIDNKEADAKWSQAADDLAGCISYLNAIADKTDNPLATAIADNHLQAFYTDNNRASRLDAMLQFADVGSTIRIGPYEVEVLGNTNRTEIGGEKGYYNQEVRLQASSNGLKGPIRTIDITANDAYLARLLKD